MLVTFNNVTFKYIDNELVKNVSFTINETDKIGLVGVNGAGKSTLLKLITGEIEPIKGKILKKNDLKISYLKQDTLFIESNTILDEIKRLTLTKEEEAFNMKSILNKLGLNDHNKQIKMLSGGEKKRLALACALIKKADLILLDEPTNHLDIWMINWLEKYLIKYNKALLIVTHDRYFLDRVTKKIFELELGSLYSYEGNYNFFLEQKVIRLNMLKSSQRKLASILKKEQKWVESSPQARSTKSKERLERFNELNNNLNAISNKIKENESEMSFSSIKTRIGKKTIIIKDLEKSYNDKTLFKNFSYILKRFDRLGIIGSNGSGKSTLFKSILGQVLPDFGTIEIGETICIGYFSQENNELDENERIIDYIKEKKEYIETIDGMLSAQDFLETFLFSPTKQYMPIRTLSGGEKRRLRLVSILMSNPNVLFLDEPTNDLDIYTLEILEDYLSNFNGAVVVVSHDRYFLDKVCDHFLVFNNCLIQEQNGIVSDYILNFEQKAKKEKQVKNDKSAGLIFTSSMKKEYESIESKIASLEEEINELEMSKNEYCSDYQELINISNKQELLNKEIDKLISRWEYLDNLKEIIKQNKGE